MVDKIELCWIIANRACVINGVLASQRDKMKLQEDICYDKVGVAIRDNGLILTIETI